ncbi:MAG: alpha/beta fold hydrolase [Actinomycetota bacterium]
MLLHGFPDTSWVWRNEIPALTAAGFRVIAPDLRGRGASDVPEGVEAYRMEELVRDVDGIMRALGIEQAHLVGHDFGAALAWSFAAFLPGKVRRLAVLAVGHPQAFLRAMTRSGQALRSWYMLFFQIPGLSEAVLSRNDFAMFRRFIQGTPDVDVYVRDLSRPGALTAALSWYRANTKPWRRQAVPKVTVPTLGLWGSRDAALGERQMKDSADFVDGPFSYERMEAGHWMMLQQPDEVNRILVEFLTER